jgi:20S proteasome alpha/beta subunit
VTIITGIICKDHIVLASDSQTTQGTMKQCSTEKISIVKLANASALVAEAGSAVLSGRAIEILQKLAKDRPLDDYRTLADLSQVAMRKLKDELKIQNCDCSMEALRDFLLRSEIGCELMLAYFFDGKPQLYTVDLLVGIANKVKSHFAAIGCGANLGGYLLSEHATPDMDPEFAAVISIYVVETVKKHDAFCDGPTRLGAVRNPLKSGCHSQDVDTFTPEEIEELAKEVLIIEESTKKGRNKQIHDSLEKLSDRKLLNLILAAER